MSTKIWYAKFDDVQVGDTVRISRELGVDHVQVTTAVVEQKTTHQLFSVNHRVLYVEGAKKDWGVIDILHRPEPVLPRTVEASEVHEHVGSRVTVEGDGYALTGRLTRARDFALDLTVDMTIIIDGAGAASLNVKRDHPITLEAPASAGASVVGEA